MKTSWILFLVFFAAFAIAAPPVALKLEGEVIPRADAEVPYYDVYGPNGMNYIIPMDQVELGDNPTGVWTPITAANAISVTGLQITPNGNYIVSGFGGVYRSTNAGSSFDFVLGQAVQKVFTLDNLNGAVPANAASPNPAKLYRTTNGGAGWVAYNLPAAVVYATTCYMTSASAVWVTGYKSSTLGQQQGSVYYSSDGGTTWTEQLTGVYELYSLAGGASGEIVGVGANGQVVRTTNSGANWSTSQATGIERYYTVQYQPTMTAFLVAGNTPASPNKQGAVERLSWPGGTFTRANLYTGIRIMNSIRVMGMRMLAAGQGISGTGVLYFSDDNGANWNLEYDNLAVPKSMTAVVYTVDGQTGVVGSDQSGMWQGSNTPLPITLAQFSGTRMSSSSVRLNWRTITETNNYGFYVQRKLQSEAEWTELANSFVAGHGTTNEPQNYSFTDNTAPASNVEYRLRQVDLGGGQSLTEPVSVSSVTSVPEIIPAEFSLAQNYPNPFNPATTIKFALPTASHVHLIVYNLLGQEVATLANEQFAAGEVTLAWNANGLASGVYVYRLQAGAFTATKKMVLGK